MESDKEIKSDMLGTPIEVLSAEENAVAPVVPSKAKRGYSIKAIVSKVAFALVIVGIIIGIVFGVLQNQADQNASKFNLSASNTWCYHVMGTQFFFVWLIIYIYCRANSITWSYK